METEMTDVIASLDGAPKKIVAFRIGAEEYGIDILKVREIRGWTETTALPHSPSYVRGVINLRGAVLPVIDLAERFGTDLTNENSRNVIIVIELGSQLLGLLVDAVADILALSREDLRETPNVASSEAKLFIEGVATFEDRMIQLVALENLLQGTFANVA
jgi:purine-binding chemotaxis protein CheW